MSEETPSQAKKLYFLHSPKSNLNAIESYLKKRNLDVILQSDPKQALVEIVQTSPDYTFIAWDHPNERVQQFPKVILQSILTSIVPFCFGNDKFSVRALQAAKMPHKLFPPITGPAIQRILMKLEKENNPNPVDDPSQSKRKKLSSTDSHQSDMVQVKSSFQSSDTNMNSLVQDLEDQQSKENLNRSNSSNIKSMNPYDKQKMAQALRKSQMSFFKSDTQNGGGTNNQTSSFAYMPQHAFAKSSPLTAALKANLNKTYEEKFLNQLSELIETFNDSESPTQQDAQFVNADISQTTLGYCLVVNSPKWSGYLIIASESYLEFEVLQTLIQQWLEENLNAEASNVENAEPDTGNENESVSSQGFYISFAAVQFDEFAQVQANYCKIIEQGAKKTIVAFFSVNPLFLNVALHTKHDMITLELAEIPTEKSTGLDIYLYLPENDKFILYLKNSDPLLADQHQRLSQKNVEHLYTALEYEQIVLRLRCESVLNLMIEEFNKAMT